MKIRDKIMLVLMFLISLTWFTQCKKHKDENLNPLTPDPCAGKVPTGAYFDVIENDPLTYTYRDLRKRYSTDIVAKIAQL